MNLGPSAYMKEIKRSYKNLKRIDKCVERYRWRYMIEGIDNMKENIKSLMSKVSIDKRNSNYNQSLRTLHKFSSEINEILQLFFSLNDLKRLNELSQTAEQIVINRTNYVIQEMLHSFQKNSEYDSVYQ